MCRFRRNITLLAPVLLVHLAGDVRREVTMTLNTCLIPKRRILLAFGEQAIGPRWLGGIDAAFEPNGLIACPTHTGMETIRRVEEGGLSAAVVVEDQRTIDGLTLLRIIRSIDRALPCWLLTEDTRRSTLETALSLQVTSVLTASIRPSELADTLWRRLQFGRGDLESL
jgi:CheY-like chemotaxis protein